MAGGVIYFLCFHSSRSLRYESISTHVDVLIMYWNIQSHLDMCYKYCTFSIHSSIVLNCCFNYQPLT